MNVSSLRLPLLATALVLGGATALQAGTVPPSARDAANQSDQPAPPPREQRAPAQREQRGPAPQRQEQRGEAPRRQQGNESPRSSAFRGNDDARRGNERQGNVRRNDDRRYYGNDNRTPQRQWRAPGDPRGGNYRPNPPRHVPTLPSGYARYNWQGRPYYYYGGSWYRPWGSQFAIVSAPIGLYVSYLPSYHTSFWYGGSRYFLADDTYYLYEPARRGYVVTRSPYGDDEEQEQQQFDDDELYVYPARGQSEQQQADDRYECHRWAVDQTRYDPVDGNYDAGRREDYMRALSACLNGRGYTVR